MDEWQPIETAPTDGRMAIVFRPLAEVRGYDRVAVELLIETDNWCLAWTVPEGQEPCNPTGGSYHVTHWMPLPEPPL